MTDGPIRRENDAIRDDSGKTYDVRGDHATDTPPDPRDAIGGETPVVMGGGAAGIGAVGINTDLDEGGGAGTDDGVRPTSDSGLHGSVAEAADLGQRPLRDYKRDADPATDATDTTMSATRSDTGPVASYTSDRDASAGATGTTGSSVGSSVGASTGSGSHVTGDVDRRENRVTPATGSATDSVDVDHRTDVAPSTSGTSLTTTGGASAGGGAIGNASAGETLTNVREGFKVVDANGDEIGKVSDLRSGDSSAATADAPMDTGESGGGTQLLAVPGGVGTGGTGTAGSAGGAGGAAAVFGLGEAGDGDGGEPNVDEPAWSRLSRIGFIKIDAKGWFASDRYAAADEVARVDGETVYLSVTKDQLISER